MHKEVNRSLIKWPAAASATMLAVSWFPMGDETDRVVPPATTQVNVEQKVAAVLETDVVIPQLEFDQADHREHAARVMKLPLRIAEAFGATQAFEEADRQKAKPVIAAARTVLKAPIRVVEKELAGLDFKVAAGRSYPRSSDLSVGHLSVGHLSVGHSSNPDTSNPDTSDPDTSDPDTSDQDTSDQDTDAGLIHGDQMGLQGRSSWLVGPMQPTFWETHMDLAATADSEPASVLPESNEGLGRRDLGRSASTRTDQEEYWSGLTRVVRVGLGNLGDSFLEILVAMTRESERLQIAFAWNQMEVGGSAEDAGLVQTEQPVVAVVGLLSVEGDAAIPQVAQTVSRKAAELRVASVSHLAGWPEAKQLAVQLKQLSSLAGMPDTQQKRRFVSVDGIELTVVDWSNTVQRLLVELHGLPRLGDKRAGEIIELLDALADDGRKQAEMLDDREQQVQWLRTTFAMSRRTAVWQPVWELCHFNDARWVGDSAGEDDSIGTAIESVRSDLAATGDTVGWDDYLLLEEVTEAARSEDMEQRAIVSQRVLSRLEWHRLDAEQSKWLKRESIQQLVSVIRPWARKAIDYANLMSQIERQEANTIDLAAVDIAAAFQSLRFAESPAAVRVADEINTHYRNANVRFAISEELMERMMSAIEPHSVAVNTRMMGTRVKGTSQIESGFDLELQPSADSWSLNLKTTGRVKTDSVGKQGVVSVRTAGAAKFDAASHLEVTAKGVYVGEADAVVSGKTRLRGIDTEYDDWPLVGMLVRSIAEDRYQSMAPQANRLGNREARVRIETEIDAQLNQRVNQASAKMSEMVLGPLGRLQLDPQVTDMQTTDRRIMARYRVAGDWQLGAFTPRPRALSDSLMSVQLHQSALNNTLEQLIPGEQPIGISELIKKTASTFGQSDLIIPEDIPDDVTVQFARTRPMTVEIEDGILWLTLRVLKLTRKEGMELTQFIVRAAYRPEMDGIHARLVRDGHLRISGPRMAMRERLPVRAIFNKVLSANRAIPMTLPRLTESPAGAGLMVSQFELRDGWLALAISEKGAARIALRN